MNLLIVPLTKLTFESFDKIPFPRTTVPSCTKLRHTGLSKLRRRAQLFHLLFHLRRVSSTPMNCNKNLKILKHN
ncbi:hypothetical protein V1477_021206 [Vespula maculifrons]|uniref:Uncharacterized protein n=1 Tax=Vespula maculifrons TaxID=7453 RepID=A0ABD2AGF4_VESMC